MNKKITPSEVLKIAGEILQWKSPMLMTVGRLNKVKLIASSAITQTHDHLNQNDLLSTKYRRLIKAKATIAQIVKYNACNNII